MSRRMSRGPVNPSPFVPVEAYDGAAARRVENTYGDPTTGGSPGPSATFVVPPSGIVIVSIEAVFALFNGTNAAGWMGFTFSGANTRAADDDHAATGLIYVLANTSIVGSLQWRRVMSGLTPGTTTITAKYRGDGSSQMYLQQRCIIVEPGGSF